MSSVSPEHKQVACMKTERRDLAAGTKTERMADYQPTRREKVIQKAGKDSLEVPQEDPKRACRLVEWLRQSDGMCACRLTHILAFIKAKTWDMK
jgi:hypothetical protein